MKKAGLSIDYKSKRTSSKLYEFLPWTITFFVPIGLIQDSVNLPKIIGFFLIVGILLLVRKNLISKIDFYQILIIFLIPLSLVASSFFDHYTFFNNLIGDFERYNGILFNTTASFLIFLLLTDYSIDLKRIYAVFIKIFLAISFVHWIQIIGINPLGGNDVNHSSLLGNSNFSSAIVATLGIVLTNYKEIFRNYKMAKAISLFSILILTLYSFGAYQGFLVLLVGLFTFVFFLVTIKRGLKLFIVVPIYTAVWILGIGILYSIVNIPFLTSVLSRSGNYERRLEYWNYAIRIFQEHPIFGVGINGFLDYSQQLKTLEEIRRDGALVWVDSAHSVPLHFLATGGICVFFAYLFFTISTSFVAIKTLRLRYSRNENSKLNLGLISMWFGFQAQSLVSISQPGTIILNSILAGLIWNEFVQIKSLVHLNINLKLTFASLQLSFIVKLVKYLWILLCFLFAIYIFVMQLFINQNIKNIDSSWVKYNHVAKMYPSDRSMEYMANSALNQSKVKEAIYLLEEAIKINPRNSRPRYSLGNIYESVGDKLAAEDYYLKAFQMNPINTFYLEKLIHIQILNSHIMEAKLNLAKLVKIDPDYLRINELSNLLSESNSRN